MLFRQSEKKSSDEDLRKLPARGPRVHSVPAVLRGRTFKGGFEAGGSNYSFSYAPSRAVVVGRRLQLQGSLTVTDARGLTRTRNQVRATVVGSQGGIGTAPPRNQLHTSVATATPQRPEVESTGPTSFCGAIYVHFEPLIGGALGVAADLSRVQLNARFAPANDAERAIQGAYSWIVDVLYGRQVDANAAKMAAAELNKLLAAN